ncbi:sigma-70 family RNA polymerase sigma factor [Deferribacter thermophilus]|uniref:RNA polymerase sigma factor n=1 Tax=Deferribacter thermophilus TaxID=53573 RepID=UPI003C1D3492
MSDKSVVNAILKGDTQSYELLIIKYQRQLFNTVISLVKDPDVADDLVQESFLKAFEKLDTLRDKSQFFPWLKRIAINLALGYLNKNKRNVDMNADWNEDGEEKTDYFESIADEGDPEEFLLKEELRRYVRKFVESLPDRLRVVVILREVEDMSYEEIAETLNIPIGTVRSRLFNARQIIKDRLINQGLADGLYKIS